MVISKRRYVDFRESPGHLHGDPGTPGMDAWQTTQGVDIASEYNSRLTPGCAGCSTSSRPPSMPRLLAVSRPTSALPTRSAQGPRRTRVRSERRRCRRRLVVGTGSCDARSLSDSRTLGVTQSHRQRPRIRGESDRNVVSGSAEWSIRQWHLPGVQGSAQGAPLVADGR
jgi:hypothetical protein